MYVQKKDILTYLEEGYFPSSFMEVVYHNDPNKKSDAQKVLDILTKEPAETYSGEEYIVIKVNSKFYMAFFTREELLPENCDRLSLDINKVCDRLSLDINKVYEAAQHNGKYTIIKHTFADLEDWICEIYNISKNRFHDYVQVDYSFKEELYGEETRKYIIYTKDYAFSLYAKSDYNDFRKSYLMGFSTTQIRLPGEDWNRGNDLPDGKFAKETVRANRNSILKYMLEPLSKHAKNNQKEKEKQFASGAKLSKFLDRFFPLQWPIFKQFSDKGFTDFGRYTQEEFHKYFKIGIHKALSLEIHKLTVTLQCFTKNYLYTYVLYYNLPEKYEEHLLPDNKYGILEQAEFNLDLQSVALHVSKHSEIYMKDGVLQPIDLYSRCSMLKQISNDSLNRQHTNEELRYRIDPPKKLELWCELESYIKKYEENFIPSKDKPNDDTCDTPIVPVLTQYPVGEDIPPDALLAIDENGKVVLASCTVGKTSFIGFNTGGFRKKGEHIPVKEVSLISHSPNMFYFRADQKFKVGKECYIGTDGLLLQNRPMQKGSRIIQIGIAITSRAIHINPQDYGTKITND